MSFVIGTASSEAVEFIFQRGLNGYMGVQDTTLDTGDTTPDGAQDSVEIDLDSAGNPAGKQGLIRFNDVFENEGGPIPTGATINSATLTLFSFDGSDSSAMINLNRMLIDWDEETETMDSIGGPLVPDGINVAIDVDAQIPTPNVVNEFEIMDVTAAAVAWLGGQANFGWLISQDSTNGFDFRSSEWAVQDQRPSLTIDFTPPEMDPDLNGDGVVNNDDFVILRGNMYAHLDGMSVSFSDGDLNFDQEINLLDFRAFKAEFPGALAGGAGIPEPSTLGLVLVTLCGILLARRRGSTAGA